MTGDLARGRLRPNEAVVGEREARHHRRSIRLRGYDYAQAGAYFVTICTWNRACLFGDVVDGTMRLNAMGEIVADEWTRSARVRAEIAID